MTARAWERWEVRDEDGARWSGGFASADAARQFASRMPPKGMRVAHVKITRRVWWYAGHRLTAIESIDGTAEWWSWAEGRGRVKPTMAEAVAAAESWARANPKEKGK